MIILKLIIVMKYNALLLLLFNLKKGKKQTEINFDRLYIQMYCLVSSSLFPYLMHIHHVDMSLR